MSLPTGEYPAILLWSESLKTKINYGKMMHFVLTDSGERGVVFIPLASLKEIAVPAGLIYDCATKNYKALDPDYRVEVRLSLQYDPKNDQMKFVSARPTGLRLLCDIVDRRKQFEPEEF